MYISWWMEKKPMLYQSTKKWQILSIYRPVSLLPVCSKIFERLIYNSIYKHITDNNLLSPNQSGFRTGGSCINQLILTISFTVLTKE